MHPKIYLANLDFLFVIRFYAIQWEDLVDWRFFLPPPQSLWKYHRQQQLPDASLCCNTTFWMSCSFAPMLLLDEVRPHPCIFPDSIAWATAALEVHSLHFCRAI